MALTEKPNDWKYRRIMLFGTWAFSLICMVRIIWPSPVTEAAVLGLGVFSGLITMVLGIYVGVATLDDHNVRKQSNITNS